MKSRAPEFIKGTIEAIRHSLVKDGYDDREIGSMKMERINKIKFTKYIEAYTQWYSYEKNKKDNE